MAELSTLLLAPMRRPWSSTPFLPRQLTMFGLATGVFLPAHVKLCGSRDAIRTHDHFDRLAWAYLTPSILTEVGGENVCWFNSHAVGNSFARVRDKTRSIVSHGRYKRCGRSGDRRCGLEQLLGLKSAIEVVAKAIQTGFDVAGDTFRACRLDPCSDTHEQPACAEGETHPDMPFLIPPHATNLPEGEPMDRPPPIAVEADPGAQLLPRLRVPDPSRRFADWWAHACCDADHRAKYPVYADLAARIIIVSAMGQEGDDRG